MAIEVKQFAVGGFDNNLSYVVAEPSTKQALVVDPTGDMEALFQYLETEEYRVTGVLLTHTHFDHYDKLSDVLERYTVPVFVHETGKRRIDAPEVVSLTEGSEVPLGDTKLHVMYTPGHNDDSVCYVVEAHDAQGGVPLLISGDTLFVGGCGRTSESGVAQLYDSLVRLKILPNDTLVYPGHDYGRTPNSTIGVEKTTNQYLLAANFDEFRELRLG